MKPKQIWKIITDILMTAVLLLLMAYSMVGEILHEWLGIWMVMLFVCHHILNSKWSRNLFKGKYTSFRMLQIVLVVLALASMAGSMVSGIVLSRHALSFLPVKGGGSRTRTLHMISAYWGFVFISLHLGLHWNMMVGMVKRIWKKTSVLPSWIVRMFGLLIAGYGAYAFIKREIGSYILLKMHFVFFDFEEPLILFLPDYMAVMGLFVFFGHYLAEIFKKMK